MKRNGMERNGTKRNERKHHGTRNRKTRGLDGWVVVGGGRGPVTKEKGKKTKRKQQCRTYISYIATRTNNQQQQHKSQSLLFPRDDGEIIDGGDATKKQKCTPLSIPGSLERRELVIEMPPAVARSIRFGSVRFGSIRFSSVRFGSIQLGSVHIGRSSVAAASAYQHHK